MASTWRTTSENGEPGDPACPTAIVDGTIYTPQQAIADGVVVVAGRRILAVGRRADVELPAKTRIIDAGGGRVIPGLIDLHLHGLQNRDSAVGTEVQEVARLLARTGVTAFLATVTPAPASQLEAALADVAAAIVTRPPGAQALGIHLEGPFLSPRQPGMMDPIHFRPFTTAEFERQWAASRGLLRLVTLAPEEPGVLAAIPILLERGVVPSIGHSNATFAQVAEAVRLGLAHASHTFNAMRGLHHREPGVVGAILAHPEITAQVIADGRHVHPAVLRLLVQVKGADKVALVSDATPLAGLPPGDYQWVGETIRIDAAGASLLDGTLAGSTALLNQGLRVLVEQAGLPFEQALVTATIAPAQALGLAKGHLQAGYDADIVMLDEAYEAVLTMIAGQVVYRKG